MRVIDTVLLLAGVSMVVGPPFVLRKTDVRLHRWNRFLAIFGFAESTLMLLIPYEQHALRGRVFYVGIGLLGVAFIRTYMIRPKPRGSE